MRSSVKIKTSFLLLAWLIIFTHGIIPHNHSDEALIPADATNHQSSCELSNFSKSLVIRNTPAEEKVCHLLNILFQNFNPENLCTHFSKESVLLAVCSSGKIYIHFSDSLVSASCRSTALFRAPPVA